MNIIDRIIKHEGFSPTVYRCPAGKLTVGYGLNIDPDGGGMTEREARMVLMLRLDQCESDLVRIFGLPVWSRIDAVRKNCLIEMRYNLGSGGFRSFKKMISAIKVFDWVEASAQARDSRWYHQVQTRAQKIVDELESGLEWE